MNKNKSSVEKYIKLLPNNINKFIILTYELINDPFLEGSIKDYTIFKITDSIDKYNDYKSVNIEDVFDFAFKYIDNEYMQVVVCNLITGNLYFRNDKITKSINSLKEWDSIKKNIIKYKNNTEFTYYDWFKTL